MSAPMIRGLPLLGEHYRRGVAMLQNALSDPAPAVRIDAVCAIDRIERYLVGMLTVACIARAENPLDPETALQLGLSYKALSDAGLVSGPAEAYYLELGVKSLLPALEPLAAPPADIVHILADLLARLGRSDAAEHMRLLAGEREGAAEAAL